MKSNFSEKIFRVIDLGYMGKKKSKKFASNNNHHVLKIGSEEYEEHLQNERTQFSKELYNEKLVEISNPALSYILTYFKDKKVKEQTGLTIHQHIIENVNNKGKSNQHVKILSLGCGPGGWELGLSAKFQVDYHMDCIDINEKSLALGQKKAESLGRKFKFIQQDINKLILPSEEYDIVLAHAALHHMINHEHIAKEVKKSMKSDGRFIVHEPIPRNGMLMWDKTKEVANNIWSFIPEKFKYDCVNKKHKKKFLNSLPAEDLSKSGFECIRSQDLYPILKENFIIEIEVFGFSFARRFFGRRFGCNYDMKNRVHKAIVDLVIKLDESYIIIDKLKPEQIFLILKKN